MSFGSSSGVVLFTHARRGGRRFYPVSLWSLTRALGVVGLIRSLWVHSRTPWGLFASSVFVLTRPSGCWVHPGSLGSLTHPGGFVSFPFQMYVEYIRFYPVKVKGINFQHMI